MKNKLIVILIVALLLTTLVVEANSKVIGKTIEISKHKLEQIDKSYTQEVLVLRDNINKELENES